MGWIIDLGNALFETGGEANYRRAIRSYTAALEAQPPSMNLITGDDQPITQLRGDQLE